jgi:hypothetical protein
MIHRRENNEMGGEWHHSSLFIHKKGVDWCGKIECPWIYKKRALSMKRNFRFVLCRTGWKRKQTGMRLALRASLSNKKLHESGFETPMARALLQEFQSPTVRARCMPVSVCLSLCDPAFGCFGHSIHPFPSIPSCGNMISFDLLDDIIEPLLSFRYRNQVSSNNAPQWCYHTHITFEWQTYRS